MSKQKSTKTETQRFSGPELSELLDQVARQHGADAAIQAVNKIRSGGVAGFFCREEFEVVVHANVAAKPKQTTASSQPAVGAAAAPTDTPSEPVATTNPATIPNPAIIPNPATIPQAAPVSEAEPTPVGQPTPGGLPTSADLPKSDIAPGHPQTAGAAPRQRSDIAPAATPVKPPSIEPPVEPVQPSEDVFAGPRPVIASETQDRFRALLEQRLEEVSETEFDLSEHIGSTNNHPAAPMRRSAPSPAMRAEPNLAPIVPAPGLPVSQETVAGGVGVLTPIALITDDIQTPDFWLRLQEVKHELSSFMPLASASVATIGPLSLTTPIVRRLRTQPALESADVIVLTDRAEIVSEPSWKLVRSGHQLVDAVLEQGEWPTLILVDVPVELPNWVAPLENRLRIAGVGLFRYAVPGNPTAEQLDNYRLGSDVPYVIDLISRVRPESLVDFIERRHPIASISGADLNAELLMAMREQVALGT